ncbi:MAG: C45 family autoproteolytic acyltransferase/hydrolase [Erythrobacter sp.]|uniref:C45 family autoproteolytic acyltransferase/hydolase n=1 Tax=Erythrobacter sp. TaxID=1042 RepID=UPI0026199B7C|nr:C45 family peptidase [Erythrobacter sp.]MDJ0979222.1 C45 family autoproteolytic acyltransferase/hydrolase [Erythrobacter sp.]
MSLELPQLTVTGTPTEMGRQYGAHFRDMIRLFVADRVRAVEAYLRDTGHEGTDRLFAAGAQCLEGVREFDPSGYQEHHGIAEGARVDPVRLFTTANMTDVRDIIAYPDDPVVVEDEGCTVGLLPPSMSANGRALQGQTWDLNGPDVDYVIALHRLPDEGPETWTVTCSGCQTLMGMNQHGVTVGTTNLKTYGAKVGVPYLSLLHRALAQETRSAASAVVEQAQVAGAHSYWIGDSDGAVEWEKTPQSSHARSTADGPLARSNHCLVDENIARETDLSPSTHNRFDRMTALLGQSDQHSVETLKALFADRADGRLSINRFAEDNSGATTNAVVACNPADLEFHACRGPADKGTWTRLEFERQDAVASA